MTSKETGERGEFLAAEYLENKSFVIVEKNRHSRYGEVDIICLNDEYILFVEVKARSGNSLGTPAEAVTISKQKKIIKTAMIYLFENPVDLQPRFDVIEVLFKKNEIKIEHIENAFSAEIMVNEDFY